MDTSVFDELTITRKSSKPAITDQYRVIERLTNAQIVLKHGDSLQRSVIPQPFPVESPLHLVYGDTVKDLHLTGIYSSLDTWIFDTESGGRVHLDAKDIRNGLPNNVRRKIYVDGEGFLILRFTQEELETCELVQKDDMVFVALLYTKGFLARGNVKIACRSDNDEWYEITPETYLETKKMRAKTVADSHITQEAVATVSGKEKEKQVEKDRSRKESKVLKVIFGGLAKESSKPDPKDPNTPKNGKSGKNSGKSGRRPT
jgi:hypothetical protein